MTGMVRMRIAGPRPAPNWADELDLLGPRARTARWAWLVLLAGLCAVAAVLPMVNEAQAEHEAAQDTVRRLERATHQHALRSQRSPRALQARAGTTGGGSSDVLSGAPLRGAARVAQTLAYPWMALLAHTESTARQQRVALLSLSVDLAGLDGRLKPGGDVAGAAMPGVDVRLSAAVMDDAQALLWAHAHGPRAQLLGRTRLPAALPAREGTYAWRVEAVWAGGTP